MRRLLRALLPLSIVAAAPPLAYLPALSAGRLLAPGDAAALHLPLRVEVWNAYSRGELPSWNPSAFSGTPLLASYRPGALHPLMPALALLPPLVAFQLLVVGSLAAAAMLAFLYARRLGAESPGALFAGLGFALGPYLVARLEDTALVVAAPALVLVLLLAERLLARGGAGSSLALALAVALLVLSGSPEAGVGCALLLGARLVLGPPPAAPPAEAGVAPASAALGPRLGPLFGSVAAGLALAAPQLVPTLLALQQAGGGVAGAASPPASPLGGMAGVIVRTVSHTPAAAFALAAVPLLRAARTRVVAVLAVALLLLLAGSGRLDTPGPLPLALDFALGLLAALSLSAQWRLRQQPHGRRLRRLALLGALVSAAALSIATTVTGPLDVRLAAPVGLLALGLVLYFALAESRSEVAARVFLLPLVASFVLQPWGRVSWGTAPFAAELEQATPTRQALDRAMGPRRSERTLSLLSAWPSAPLAADLAWANLAVFAERRNANGYDPLVPAARSRTLDGMGTDGLLPRTLLTTDPGRLELLGIRWLQVPTETLVTEADAAGLGDALDVVLEEPRPHLFALPITPATEVRLTSFLAGATRVEQGTIVAECVARLASGREIWLPIRAGVDTAEWAWDRPDVRARVRHAKAKVHASHDAGGFSGHEYETVLKLPGRFFVNALRFRGWPQAPPLRLLRAGLSDGERGRSQGLSLAAAYASDEVRLAQVAATPRVSLFEVRRGVGPAWVVESLRRLPDEARVLDLLRSPTRLGVDPRREALISERDAAGSALSPTSRSSAANVAIARGGRLVIRASGPGLLVVGEGFDPGWTARVDRRPARVLRVNGDRIGVVLAEGNHRVVLRHRARGLGAGLALAAAAFAGLTVAFVRGRRRGRG